LRIRLALLQSAVIAIVVIGLGVYVYLTMARYTENTMKFRITGRAQLLTTMMAQVNSPSNESPFSVPSLETLEGENTVIQIEGEYGNVLVSSTRLGSNEIPVPAWAMRTAVPGAPVFYWTKIEEIRYLVGLFPLAVWDPNELYSGRPGGYVVVARSEKVRAETLSDLLRSLIIGGAASIAAAWLMGWFTAGTALKPIRETIQTARAIARSRGFVRKLTPRKSNDELGQMVAAFNEMLKNLEEAQVMQQRFVADASHELRAPLTVIRGNLDLLERARDMPPQEQAEVLSAARAEVERMSRLVADLLSLARADSGMRLEKAEVELDSVVLEIYQQLLASPTHVRLSLSHLEPLLVSGDRDRLKQLVLILVDNAIRYTPAGGSVTLSLRPKGDQAVLAVADTGIGIDPKDQPHVFERFYRSERAQEMDPGGTGLGLAIAQWIVDDHGGELDLRSTPGQGTTATIRLPLLH
jgi:two-component system OmpR family sensor kinase